tara:strand:+ start:78913 stop:79425 length:513 start_codon:yes stop_codon:yes gene_type:complete
MNLKEFIHDIPDFPKPGIIFKDISPLLRNPEATRETVLKLSKGLDTKKIDQVVGIESRGFLLGILLAQHLQVGFTLMRKPDKLPGKVIKQPYALEYGEDAIEIQENAIKPGQKVILHDDVLATGGTAAAAQQLIQSCGAEVIEFNFLMELDFLKGREKLGKTPIKSLLNY